MRIIAVTAGKGGVGKTTLVSNLGLALTKLGFRTAVLDANFTTPDIATHFGMEPETTIWEVLAGEPIEDAIYEHNSGLHIIPGALKMPKKFDRDMYKKLKRKTRTLKYDCLLIDTPAGLGDDARAALMPCKEALIVANPEWPSVFNAGKAAAIAKELKKKVIGLALNRSMVHEYEPKEEVVEDLLCIPVLQVIPEDLHVRKAIVLHNPVVVSYPDSPAGTAIMELAGKISGVEYRPKRGLWDRVLDFFGLGAL